MWDYHRFFFLHLNIGLGNFHRSAQSAFHPKMTTCCLKNFEGIICIRDVKRREIRQKQESLAESKARTRSRVLLESLFMARLWAYFALVCLSTFPENRSRMIRSSIFIQLPHLLDCQVAWFCGSSWFLIIELIIVICWTAFRWKVRASTYFSHTHHKSHLEWVNSARFRTTKAHKSKLNKHLRPSAIQYACWWCLRKHDNKPLQILTHLIHCNSAEWGSQWKMLIK